MKRGLNRLLLALAVCCFSASEAAARTYTDETDFQHAILGPTTVSFNLFSVGFLPQTTLQMGAVTVVLTSSGTSPIFGPGPFGFTTNFLSVGVQDGGNNVVITFPAGTRAAGLKIASVLPVTVTATYASGSEVANFSASQVSFLGFAGSSEIQTITISSPFVPQTVPIVNVGDITYASALASVVPVPTLSELGLVAFALGLLLAGWRLLPRTSQ